MEEGFRRWANPSSPHAEGRAARALLEDARERIKAALGWDGELIFTSGASEALAIGLNRASRARKFASAVEHDAVFRAAPAAHLLPACAGVIELPDDLSDAVVAIQQVNPETGTMLLETGDVHGDVVRRGGVLLADCSQGAGKLPLPECDLAVISAHKLGGPVGIGALLVRDFALLEPTGGHERGYRTGTENMPAALGFAAALETGGPLRWAEQQEMRAYLGQRLSEVRLMTGRAHCDHILALTHPFLSAHAQLIGLDALGMAVSAGSACSSGTIRSSRVLEAFGVVADTAARTIRISLGWSTTRAQVERFCQAWLGLGRTPA